MHEMSIAIGIIEQANAAAIQHGAGRIRQINVVVGATQLVDVEALQLAFSAAQVDTPADGAQLNITHEAAVARCRGCAMQFEPTIEPPDFRCPHCGRADAEMIAGHEIILKALECEEAAAEESQAE